jgi:hypothetical protein
MILRIHETRCTGEQDDCIFLSYSYAEDNDSSWESWDVSVYDKLSHDERIDAWIDNNPFIAYTTIQELLNCYKLYYNLTDSESDYIWLKLN